MILDPEKSKKVEKKDINLTKEMAIVDPYIYYYVSCCYEVDVLYLYKRFLFHCIVQYNKKYDKIYEPPILEVSVHP